MARPLTTGLYDSQGVLRFSGHTRAACLAYAELFGLEDSDFTLVSLLRENLEDDVNLAQAA
jgi:hypothetical protein